MMIEKLLKIIFAFSCLLIFIFLGLYFEYLKIRLFLYIFISLFIVLVFLLGFFYAKKQFPEGWESPKPYIRMVPEPKD